MGVASEPEFVSYSKTLDSDVTASGRLVLESRLRRQ